MRHFAQFDALPRCTAEARLAAARAMFDGDAVDEPVILRPPVGRAVQLVAVTIDADRFNSVGWTLLGSVRNPWGQVPLTAGGHSLDGRSRVYMDRLLAQQKAQNPVSRRHHYVPQTYLREWSFDGKRVWAHDTVTGAVKPLGLTSVCVKEFSTGWSDRTAHHTIALSCFRVTWVPVRVVRGDCRSEQASDQLLVDELIHAVAAQLTAEAGALDAAERKLGAVQQHTVDEHHAGVDLVGHPCGLLGVGGEEVGA